jgi:rare lipoprotein A
VLPVPSYARVTNLENGQSVLVRVNDRGPYMKGRVIDLSYQAAAVLGYVNQGSAQVEVRYVGPAPLQGDDTRMLTASVNRLTALEQQQTRFAMVEPQQTAPLDPFASGEVSVDNGRVNFADYQAQQGRSRGDYSGKDLADDFLGLFGYAETDPIGAAHAAANAMASRDTGLQDWVNAVDEEARAIKLPRPSGPPKPLPCWGLWTRGRPNWPAAWRRF